VSHNLTAVRNLCSWGVILAKGELKFNNTIEKTIENYVNEQGSYPQKSLSEIKDRVGDGSFRFTKIELSDTDNNVRDTFITGETLVIKLFFDYTADFERSVTSQINIGIYDLYDVKVSWLGTYIFTDKFSLENNYISFRINRLLFNEGSYKINLHCATDIATADYIMNAAKLNIVLGNFFGTGRRTAKENQGYIVTDFTIE
jgi:lipopolysaccharide transport system ATP-binding protein